MYINKKSESWKFYEAFTDIVALPLVLAIITFRLYLKVSLWLVFGVPWKLKGHVRYTLLGIRFDLGGGGRGDSDRGHTGEVITDASLHPPDH